LLRLKAAVWRSAAGCDVALEALLLLLLLLLIATCIHG